MKRKRRRSGAEMSSAHLIPANVKWEDFRRERKKVPSRLWEEGKKKKRTKGLVLLPMGDVYRRIPAGGVSVGKKQSLKTKGKETRSTQKGAATCRSFWELAGEFCGKVVGKGRGSIPRS